MNKPKLHKRSESILVFYCPGCKCAHQVSLWIWKWNGSYASPTFSPSILIQSGHYATPESKTCWCTYNIEHANDPSPFKCEQCHSFVTDGKIKFLSDCTHELKGQTVLIPDWEE